MHTQKSVNKRGDEINDSSVAVTSKLSPNFLGALTVVPKNNLYLNVRNVT